MYDYIYLLNDLFIVTLLSNRFSIGMPQYKVFYVICHGELCHMSQYKLYLVSQHFLSIQSVQFTLMVNIFVLVCKNIDIIINNI